MSDINENSTMSTEQKFLGVKAKIGTKPDEVVEPEGEIDIEIIDDVEAKPEKKEKVFAEDSKENEVDGNVNEEIINVDKGVQKRIDQLTAKHHEERRQKEQASKLRDEAIIYAQRVKSENDRLNKLVSDGQQYLGRQAEERAGFAKQAAEQKYKQAYEQGNTEEMVAAQDALTRATMDAANAEQFNARIPEEQFIPQQQQEQFVPQQQMPPRPDNKAVSWQAKNQWFGSDSEMTSFAYGVHEKLVREEGIDPQSSEYYEKIDARMKQVFPDFFGSNASAVSANSQSSVVAPATRNNGAKPRKVQLTATQVALAKRIGVTPEQYANQLVKDMSANN
jgi:gamma-glutamylcyclotransferase (GGCT)/AIG2-like uncharacterized protein YtfP|tara:strand:+ start:374 stop:1378 length:1005 start_codon:yes stop_codon:yes gene_type:complete